MGRTYTRGHGEAHKGKTRALIKSKKRRLGPGKVCRKESLSLKLHRKGGTLLKALTVFYNDGSGGKKLKSPPFFRNSV